MHVVNVGEKMATVVLPSDAVVEVDSAWKKPPKWKAMKLSREFRQLVLNSCGCLKFLEEDDNFAAEVVEPIKPVHLCGSYCNS